MKTVAYWWGNTHLHVDQLDSSTITRRENMEDLNATTVTIPRRTILEDLRNLKQWLLGVVSRLRKLNIKQWQWPTSYLCGLKAHKTASSGCYANTIVRNSDDSNGIRTRLQSRSSSGWLESATKKKSTHCQYYYLAQRMHALPSSQPFAPIRQQSLSPWTGTLPWFPQR
jgi:hypothetical protein